MTLARGLPIQEVLTLVARRSSIKMEMLFHDDGSEGWFGVGRVDLVGRCDVVSPNRESGGDVTSLNLECGGGDMSNAMLIMESGTSRRCQEIGSLCRLDARDNASVKL